MVDPDDPDNHLCVIFKTNLTDVATNTQAEFKPVKPATAGSLQKQTDPNNGPAGRDVWRAAEAVLRDACSYGTDNMSYASLDAAGHVLPHDWSFERDGAWSCPYCQKEVRNACRACEDAKAHVAYLQGRAAGEDEEAHHALSTLMKEHANAHMDATYLEAPIVRVGTDSFIVDPMHCQELNLTKAERPSVRASCAVAQHGRACECLIRMK
eukprot:1511443-Pleurochrysis_carterae.AAC.1